MGRPPKCNRCCRTPTPVVPGNPFSFGGFSFPSRLLDNDEFDEATSTWASRTNLPSPSRFVGHAAGLSGVGYHMGGEGGSPQATLTDNDAYTKSTNSWAAKTSDSVGKIASHDAAVVGSVVYNTYTDSTDVKAISYTPSTDSWSALATNTGYAVFAPATGTDGVDVFACGGALSGSAPVKTVEKYAIAGDTWSSRTDMPTPARSSASPLSRPSAVKLVCAFGDKSSPSPVVLYRDVDEYTSGTDSWASLGDAPPPARTRMGHTVVNSTTGYVMSGSDSGHSNETREFDSYAFNTDTWSTEPQLPLPARFQNAGAAV